MNLVVVAACVGLMFSYDVLLTLVGLGSPRSISLPSKPSLGAGRTSHAAVAERGKLLGTSMAGLQTIETLKATGADSDFFGRWSGQMAKVLESSQRMEVEPLAGAGAVAPHGPEHGGDPRGGAVRVMDGHMTVGMLVAFQSLTASLMGPVEQFLWMGSTLQEVEGEMLASTTSCGTPSTRRFKDRGRTARPSRPCPGLQAGWRYERSPSA